VGSLNSTPHGFLDFSLIISTGPAPSGGREGGNGRLGCQELV
jgi:hypothetical protein